MLIVKLFTIGLALTYVAFVIAILEGYV